MCTSADPATGPVMGPCCVDGGAGQKVCGTVEKASAQNRFFLIMHLNVRPLVTAFPV